MATLKTPVDIKEKNKDTKVSVWINILEIKNSITKNSIYG